MSEEFAQDSAPVAATEPAVETPAPAEPETANPGTAEPATPVAETEEQKALRLAKEGRTKWERAQRKIQERFGELTEEKRQLARQVEQLTQALLGKQQPTAQPDGPPKREQFEDFESFIEARAEWRAEQRAKAILEQQTRAQREAEARQQVERQAQTIGQEFAKRQSEFAKAHPDYESVVLHNDDVQIPDSALALIPMLPDGHVAAYAIGKNPELAQQLWGKSPVEQAAMLTRIAVTFQAAPQVSNAPPPSQPVAAKSKPTNTEPSDEDSYEDWVKKRNAQEKRAR